MEFRGSKARWRATRQPPSLGRRHATIEEELFYPACKAAVEDGLEHEAYVEHDGAKVLIAEIAASTPDDDAKVTVHRPFRNGSVTGPYK